MKTFMVLGGGPAAAIEAARLCALGKEVTLISEQFGGCMEIMGERRLQSYCHELTLTGGDITLDSCMERPALAPAASEFSDYVRRTLDALPVKKISGKVSWFTKENDRFRCHVTTANGERHLYADGLVLATGIRARPVPAIFSLMDPITCFEAYNLFRENDARLKQYRRVVILGGGNTAFQLADCAASLGIETTILAKSYLGIFPQETQDRFALRAPSQLTIERIWKSQNDKNMAPLAFHIYSSLYADGERLHIWLQEARNQIHIARLCWQALPGNGDDATAKMLPIAKAGTLFISAIGTTGNLPPNGFRQLQLDKQGFLPNRRGRTAIAGLYVAGALAGAKSVNTMIETEYGHEKQNAVGEFRL
ncbi:FAD-dependent oxidoreductase [Mixta sp. Marseille-Q2659]|uniref:FAD-dependent oxidoreductase n=1 Tax=Mixta sp. Marseille-Q2659 TaxID=2736607 RepID=UPI0023B8F45E|nr:FAD-dependent oxidoreductase [Mixta sp. Marseille-Q2659]